MAPLAIISQPGHQVPWSGRRYCMVRTVCGIGSSSLLPFRLHPANHALHAWHHPSSVSVRMTLLGKEARICTDVRILQVFRTHAYGDAVILRSRSPSVFRLFALVGMCGILWYCVTFGLRSRRIPGEVGRSTAAGAPVAPWPFLHNVIVAHHCQAESFLAWHCLSRSLDATHAGRIDVLR